MNGISQDASAQGATTDIPAGYELREVFWPRANALPEQTFGLFPISSEASTERLDS